MLQRQSLLKIAIFLLILAPVGAVIFSFLGLALNLPVPATAEWLYNHQADFKGKLRGDRQVGGGYFFLADGRDLWIRFRVQPPLPKNQAAQISNRCTSDERIMVSEWFLNHAVNRKDVLGWVALPDEFEQDRNILQSPADLQCTADGAMTHRFGEVPSNCSSWSLYDRQTHYYYLRYACYN